MSALSLTLFVSGGVVAMAIIAFFAAVVRRDHEHADRLSSLPLDDDSERVVAIPAPAPARP